MPIVLCIKNCLLWLFDRLADCLPTGLTTSLTVLEIVYYLIACTLFSAQLILLLLGRTV
jgi:hypothetical protein